MVSWQISFWSFLLSWVFFSRQRQFWPTVEGLLMRAELSSPTWQEAESPAMTEEATAAFNEATEGFVGVDYVPVALLSTQTVAGTNYRILCEATTVYPGAEMHYAVVNVYESLEGNANIISVTDGYVS